MRSGKGALPGVLVALDAATGAQQIPPALLIDGSPDLPPFSPQAPPPNTVSAVVGGGGGRRGASPHAERSCDAPGGSGGGGGRGVRPTTGQPPGRTPDRSKATPTSTAFYPTSLH